MAEANAPAEAETAAQAEAEARAKAQKAKAKAEAEKAKAQADAEKAQARAKGSLQLLWGGAACFAVARFTSSYEHTERILLSRSACSDVFFLTAAAAAATC